MPTRATRLLERSDQLAALQGHFDSVVSSGRGAFVLVAGEAGVGKTALVHRFAADQEAARVLSGACDPLFTPRPLGAILDIAQAVGGELELAVRAGRLPHEAAAALIDELKAHPPTVVVVEDVHWADEATLDVLRLLARRIVTMPALMIATYRDDELDRAHPLRVVLGDMLGGEAIHRVKLAPLSATSTAALAEPYGVDAKALHHKTGGNPFFIGEVLAAADQDIPDTVRDAVLARTARLSEKARSLAEAVAAIPSSAELWLLQTIAPDSIDRLEECMSAGVLLAGPSTVSFRHELAQAGQQVRPRGAGHRAYARQPARAPARLAELRHHARQALVQRFVLRVRPGGPQ